MNETHLDMSAQFLKGVGEARARALEKMGVKIVADLLDYIPRDYEQRPPVQTIETARAGQTVSLKGQVIETRYQIHSRPPRFLATIQDDSATCNIVWFHGGYLRGKIEPGLWLIVVGKIELYKNTLQLVNPTFQILTDNKEADTLTSRLVPIYPAGGTVKAGQIARIFNLNLAEMLDCIEEWFPEAFLKERNLLGRRSAYHLLHAPPARRAIAPAYRRLAFDEFFLMELGVGLRRVRHRRRERADAIRSSSQIDARIRRRFPFTFTGAQDRVVGEIAADLAQPHPMNRLLQGDVGSGKTAVALYAALVAIANRKQVAFMAPTEILAEQHFLNIEKYLAGSRVRRALLTGSTTAKKKRDLLVRVGEGEIDLLVGTHALQEESVGLKQLGLVIIDEQHKFGVMQRARLRAKGLCPHCLVMTATPIPRTLSLTIFGDLDVSILDELPPGRRPITTRWVSPDRYEESYTFIRRRLDDGEQAFFVYPLIEESEELIAKAATEEEERLAQGPFADYRVGLLHGRMHSAEKEKVMTQFRNGELHLVVATQVIEVGVDVPAATVMVIENAERFGLAQLHQLRGRIGRGGKPGFCLLFGNPKTPEAKRRLEIMVQTTDGFRIAEEDLRIRGPGEFFGTRQHGLPELRFGNIIDDVDLLLLARRDAFAMLESDPELKSLPHQPLARALHRKFADYLGLIDVG